MNLIKWALWLIVFLVVVAIGGAIFLAQTVDPNSFKAQISEKLEQQIGRKLQLDGDISWRFYPSLGLTLNDFALSNRVGFTPENMLSAEKAEVQVKLLPLIEKKLEVGKVKLIAPKVFLAINAKGESNWADLSQSNKQTLTTNPEQQASAALGGLVIQGVDISNGEVHWDNAQADQHYDLNAFNLTTGAVIPGKATDFDLSSEVSSPSFTESGDVQAKGALWVSEAFDVLKLTGFTTQVNLGDINADLQANTIEYSLASGVAMIDQLSYSGEYAQLPIKGALSGLRFDGEKNSVSIAQKTLNATLAGVSANLEAAQLDVDLNRGVLLAPSLKIQANDAQLDVSLKVVDLFDQLKASGKLSSNTLKPKDLLAALGVDALDEMPEQALAALQLETGFTAGLNSIALDNLQLRLDDSTITGDFSMADFSSPAYRFNLAVDKLNADNYMSTDNKQVAEKTGPGAVVALPFAALKGLDVKGTLSITELDILEMASHDVKVNIDTTADKITISPLSAKVYGGVTRNTFSYDISGDIPKVEIESTLESLNLGPFLQAMQMTDRLEGFGNVSTQIQSSGLTADEIIASMQGDIHISLNDGALRGANIQKTLVDASKLYKQLKGKELDLGAELEDETKFSKLSSDIKVNQGILSTQNIDLKAPGLRLRGVGTVDLNTQQLNLDLIVGVDDSFQGQGGEALNELKGEKIPVKITGSLNAPKIRPDFSKILRRALERKLSEKYLGEKSSGADLKTILQQKLDKKLAEKLGLGSPEVSDQNTQSNDSGELEYTPPFEAPAPDIQQQVPEQEPMSDKDRLKKELKNKLLDKLFGG